MSNKAKIVLGVGAITLTLLLGVVIVGVRWFFANKDRIAATTRRTIDEGARFGRTHAPSECPAEAMRRAAECTEGAFCATFTNFFLGQCVQMREPDEALCAGVPPAPRPTEPNTWPQQRCTELGHGDRGCVNTMQFIQGYCHRP
jgi:hypothetical protein